MSKNVLKILTLSDIVESRLYSPYIRDMFPDVDLVISCGDLPYYYLEYILDTLNVPMFFVHGNHDPEAEISDHGERQYPWGATDLHGKVQRYKGLIIAGLEGSIRYSSSKYQYSQTQMWTKVIGMIPKLLFNKLIYGRFLDVLVSHSPPWKLNDGEDFAHRGFKAIRWLLKIFKPTYHIHGHVHIYDRQNCQSLKFEQTEIINSCSYQRLTLEVKE